MARRQFKLPDVGEGLTEGEILTWHVAVGDTVTINQVLVEVETAKAAVELPSPYAGEVVDLHAGVGEVVDVGVAIITIETEPGTPPPTSPAAGPGSATAAVADAMGGEEQVTGTGSGADEVGAGLIGGEAPGGRTAVLVGYGPRTTTAKRRPRRAAAPRRRATEPVEGTVPGGPLGTEDTKPTRHGGLEVGRLTEARESPHAGQAVPAHTIPAGEPNRHGRVSAPPVLAKPPVRKMARDLGVDLAAIAPSGPGGTITREDVAAAAGMSEATGPSGPGPRGVTPDMGGATAGAAEERIPVRGVRRATAQAMVTSAFTAPHVTEFLTVDATGAIEFLDRLRAHPIMTGGDSGSASSLGLAVPTSREAARTPRPSDGVSSSPGRAGRKVSPLLLVARAVCLALRRTPEANASWDETAGEIVIKRQVNLGIAAATPRGLLVPNIKDAGSLALPELAEALATLTATAREGRCTPAELTGGTITITNVGVFGVDAGTPIINPGESAILAVGTIAERPWVVGGAVVPRQVCTLSLSFDHRIVDGEAGSRFLVDVASVLQDPAAALLL